MTPQEHEALLKNDFRHFMVYAWKYQGLPKPTWIQTDMAKYMQHGPRRRGVLAFRGVAKSTIAVAFVVWSLWRNPDMKIMIVSASKDRADDFTAFVLNLMKVLPLCQHLVPKRDEGERTSRIQFDVSGCKPSGSPSVKSRGITSAITGARADLIIADDIEITNNSLTQVMRDKLAHAVKEFDAILKPGGTIMYLGTPQTGNTIYTTLQQRGYEFLIWPVMFPTEEQAMRYGPMLAPSIREVVEANWKMAGQPTDPLRFNDKEIAERLLSYGALEFARQFMLDTRLADSVKFPLRLSDLIVTEVHPDLAPEQVLWASGPGQIIDGLPNVGMDGDRLHRPLNFLDKDGNPPRRCPYQGKVMAIDPGGRGGDETGFAIVYMLHGMLFLVKAGGLRGGYSEENLQKLANLARDYKVNKVLIESNFGDGMFTALLIPYLKKTYAVSTEEVRSSIQKERRICDTLEPIVQQHRLIVDPKCFEDDVLSTLDYVEEQPYLYQLWWQFTRVTRERGALRKDDRLDALAIAVAHYVEQLSKDLATAALDGREAAAEAYRREFVARLDRKLGIREGWQDSWVGDVVPTVLQ